MRGICLDHLTIVDAKPDELVTIAAALGCVAVGMLVRPVPMPGAASFDLLGNVRYQNEVRRRCADSAVAIQLIEPFELTVQTAWDVVRATLETGAALGGKAAGWRAYDPDGARLLQQFGRFSQLAHEFGMGTVLEFTPRTVVRTLADAVNFLRQAHCPRARINFDVLHWIRSGGSQTNIEIECPQLIGHVQVCDGLSRAVSTDNGLYEAGCHRLAPGEGDFNLPVILASLPREPLIGVEIPRADLMEAGVSAAERAGRAVAATRELLARLAQ